MDVFLITAGVIIIAVAMFDAFWTTVRLAGGGPFTMMVGRGLWKAAGAHRRGRQGIIPSVGSVILLVTIFLWIAAVMVGYLLIFSGDAGAVVHGQTGQPADLAERAYFTGFTLFTLGVGDYVPGGDAWRLVTVAATLNGLFLITLSITYIIPVISAAVAKRQLAAVISNLGGTPQELVARAWDGGRFSSLGDHLVQIMPMLEHHAQRHLAYPILHYFDTTARRAALAPALSTLYDAILILQSGIAAEHRPAPIYVDPIQEALRGLLEILGDRFISRHGGAPPAPDLAPLGEAGIPLASGEGFGAAVAACHRDRATLSGFVEHTGWRSR